MALIQDLNISDPPDAEGNTQAQLRTLIVDDSRLQRRILCASLSRLGYQVREAESGDEALAICDDWAPDMVLSDWMMPGMNGLEFCRAFKEMPREGYGYFILLTSKSAKDEVAQGLEAGADDFLSKPVNGLELRARLAAGERIVAMQRELSEKNAVITRTLDQLQTVHDSLNSDLIEAKKLQHSLVREKHRRFARGEMSFLLRASGHVGGDLVGYFPISPDEVGMFSIDVSGHGVSSALMTARLAGLLTSASAEQNIALYEDELGHLRAHPPAEVVAELNRLILAEMETDHYFTMILACIDMRDGQVVLCQAGHPHPLVQRRDGRIEQNGLGGMPIGLIEEAEFEEMTLKLEPGDRLLLASDGITECPDPMGQMLEEDGLTEIVVSLLNTPAAQMLEALVWTLSDYAGDAGFPDDVSAALFEYASQTERTKEVPEH